jgi:hypothetical protein
MATTLNRRWKVVHRVKMLVLTLFLIVMRNSVDKNKEEEKKKEEESLDEKNG